MLRARRLRRRRRGHHLRRPARRERWQRDDGGPRRDGPWTAPLGRRPARRRAVDRRPAPVGLRSPSDLVGLALRRNPRRAHLLVSPVLGKHVPADPRLVARRRPAARARWSPTAGRRRSDGIADDGWASCCAAALCRRRSRGRRLALLGAVPIGTADAPASDAARARLRRDRDRRWATAWPTRCARRYLHSTRRPVPGVVPVRRVRRGALARHRAPAAARPTRGCWPAPARWCWSTTSCPPAATAHDTIARAARALAPATRYVVAALVDLRSAGRPRAAAPSSPRELGVPDRRGRAGHRRGRAARRTSLGRGRGSSSRHWRGPAAPRGRPAGAAARGRHRSAPWPAGVPRGRPARVHRRPTAPPSTRPSTAAAARVCRRRCRRRAAGCWCSAPRS